MAPDDLQSRLTDLPGVISCTVQGDTVALFLHPEVDPRLLKARAQAVCAEAGETRPLIVVGGRPSAGAGAARGVGAGGGGRHKGASAFLARRATPVSIAVLSLFVLSAVVLAPDGPDRSAPFSRLQPSPTVALAPSPGAVPPLGGPGPGSPPVAATPRVPSFDLPDAPLPPDASSVAAGPVLVGLPPSPFAVVPGTAAGQADVAPTPTPGVVGIATPLASSSPAPAAASAGAGPGPSAPPPPAISPAAAAVQETSRTSSAQLAASSSVEKTRTWSQHGRRYAPRQAAPADLQPAVSTKATEGKAETAQTSRHPNRGEGPGAAATPEKPERAQNAERSQHGEGTAKPEQPERAQKAERSQPGQGNAKPERPSVPAKAEERGAGRSSDRGK